MRLKTKLVLAATAMTFSIVLVLSLVFLGELLRQRIRQTAASNEVLARQVLRMTRQAVEVGLRARPPADLSDETLHAAVEDALRSHQPLNDLMNSIVLYSPAVQDVSVTDAHGYTLDSTDATMLGQLATTRRSFDQLTDGTVITQVREMFGPPRVLDVAAPLNRNGMPFLVVHIGVRSSFLKNNYEPVLRAAMLVALLAVTGAMLAAALLTSLAVRPIEEISRRLERLTAEGEPVAALPPSGLLRLRGTGDAVVRVTATIDRLGEQIRSAEAGYTALQANLNQMLDSLRDGVLLFTPERRAVMVSDAVEHFVVIEGPLVGRQLEDIFPAQTALGAAVLEAVNTGARTARVELEDGRLVQIGVDRFGDEESGAMGTLLTLRDTETAARLEQEMEVSRRLAAIGKLTAGVGHEVKNPINAMVLHLELLKSKLAASGEGNGAQRHVDILADEMQRLDRVVQTLADFSRPMDLDLREQDMGALVDAVVELTDAEMAAHGVEVQIEVPEDPVVVRVDGELIRQAVLNLALNAMQAMPQGGMISLVLRRERQFAVLEVTDQGEGIAPEVMPHIFDLYFTTKPAGSGIGLAMTYRIVQMHGGALEVRSNGYGLSGDRGTTFTVRLPMAARGAV